MKQRKFCRNWMKKIKDKIFYKLKKNLKKKVEENRLNEIEK